MILVQKKKIIVLYAFASGSLHFFDQDRPPGALSKSDGTKLIPGGRRWSTACTDFCWVGSPEYICRLTTCCFLLSQIFVHIFTCVSLFSCGGQY